MFMAWSRDLTEIVARRWDWILRSFSLAWINLRPDIRLRATRKSASSLSYSKRFVAKRKLVLIRAMTELPVGSLKVGHTNSFTD